MTQASVSDYYDRHWRNRIDKEPGSKDVTWKDQGAVRLLVKHGKALDCVMDLGCGIGLTFQFLATIPGVKRLIGIEPSPLAIVEAKRRFPQAEIHEAFAEDISVVPDNTCDAVVALAVMEHIYDTHRVLNEINRVLKPGGLVAVYTTDFNLLKKVLVALFAFEKCFDVCGGHIRFFTRKSLAAVMEEHGFETVAQEWDTTYFGIMPQGQNALFRKVRSERILREVN